MNLGFLFRSFSQFSPHQFARSQQHHRDIVRAIETGDPDWAAAQMKTHILAARDIFKGTDAGG